MGAPLKNLSDERFVPLSWTSAIGYGIAAIATFHLAFAFRPLGFLVGVFLFCLCKLTTLRTPRFTFYFGLILGVSLFAPRLAFFWGIFHYAALGLWLIAALWPALFLILGRGCRRSFPPLLAIMALPILWTGLEYFRSEVYPLRFSWMNVAMAFPEAGRLGNLGVYGVGFVLMTLAAGLLLLPMKKGVITGAILMAAWAGITDWPSTWTPPAVSQSAQPFVVGIQLENVSEEQILAALNEALIAYPQADLLVLGEYSFYGPVPKSVHDWCRIHRRYLIVGGTDPANSSSDVYMNTAFVVGPQGEVAFKQGKCRPIQFFSDGLPAKEQRVWDSPWGKIGLCICYDLSYRQVTDALIRDGAGAIIVPTMDLISWGASEHAEHARMGPVRAAEYAVPVVRVCSSGISQIVEPNGQVMATAEFPGQGQRISGRIQIQPHGRIPLDAWLGPMCVMAATIILAALIVCRIRAYSTVTLLARLRGLSTLQPRATARMGDLNVTLFFRRLAQSSGGHGGLRSTVYESGARHLRSPLRE